MFRQRVILWVSRVLMIDVSATFWSLSSSYLQNRESVKQIKQFMIELPLFWLVDFVIIIVIGYKDVKVIGLCLGKLKYKLPMVTTLNTMYTSQYWAATKPWTSTNAQTQLASISVPRPTRDTTVRCATINHRNQDACGGTLKRCILASRLCSMKVCKVNHHEPSGQSRFL